MKTPRRKAHHVEVTIDETELDGDYGPVQGVIATCSRCGNETEAFGTSEASVKRCCALLREECPNGETEVNWYAVHD